jgi:molybdate transport system substrate-binding protein
MEHNSVLLNTPEEDPRNMTITLFSALVVRKAFDEAVVPAFETATGSEVAAVYDPTVQLARRVEAGERFDVLVAATDSLAGFGAAVDLGTATPILRTGIGVAVAGGAPHPDISTTEALVRALTKARSVAYSRTGQSGIYFARLLERLGIADQVRVTVLEKGFTAEAVIEGRADLAIQQLSELLFVPGCEIVGPLPDEVQHVTEFSASLGAHSADRAQSQAFVDFLRSSAAQDAFRATRLEPVVS